MTRQWLLQTAQPPSHPFLPALTDACPPCGSGSTGSPSNEAPAALAGPGKGSHTVASGSLSHPTWLEGSPSAFQGAGAVDTGRWAVLWQSRGCRDGCGADAARPPGTSPPRERPRPEPPPCGCRCSPVECQDGLGSGLQARSISVPLTARARAELSEPLKADARGRTQAGLVDVRCVTGTPSSLGTGSCPPNSRIRKSSHRRKAKPEAAAMRARSSREGPAAAFPTPDPALLTRTPCVTLGPTGPGV